jgi:hypothetical protein
MDLQLTAADHRRVRARKEQPNTATARASGLGAAVAATPRAAARRGLPFRPAGRGPYNLRMVRRGLRFSFLLCFLVLLGLALYAQFWIIFFNVPGVVTSTGRAGISAEFRDDWGWGRAVLREDSPWSIGLLLLAPSWRKSGPIHDVFVPWYLMLGGAGLMTGVVWRLTKRPQCRGFPVEPATSGRTGTTA